MSVIILVIIRIQIKICIIIIIICINIPRGKLPFLSHIRKNNTTERDLQIKQISVIYANFANV